MKERLITLLCAIGALVLFAIMFLNREGTFGGRFDAPRPITSERRGNGYHAGDDVAGERAHPQRLAARPLRTRSRQRDDLTADAATS